MLYLGFSEFLALLATEGRASDAPSLVFSNKLLAGAELATQGENAHSPALFGPDPAQSEPSGPASVRQQIEDILRERAGYHPLPLPPTRRYTSARYISPHKVFCVTLAPEWVFELEPFPCVLHVWPHAPLQKHIIDAALTLIASGYDDSGNNPPDIGLVSLRDATLHRLSDAVDCSSAAHDLARRLEAGLPRKK